MSKLNDFVCDFGVLFYEFCDCGIIPGVILGSSAALRGSGEGAWPPGRRQDRQDPQKLARGPFVDPLLEPSWGPSWAYVGHLSMNF